MRKETKEMLKTILTYQELIMEHLKIKKPAASAPSASKNKVAKPAAKKTSPAKKTAAKKK